MASRKNITPVKASESVISRMLARALYVPVASTIIEVCTSYADEGRNMVLKGILRDVHGLYPWVVPNVAKEVMGESLTPMTTHLLSMPGSVFILKDNNFSGADSLWVAMGDPPVTRMCELLNFQHRGLIHTGTLPNDELATIFAFQLTSCRI